jgi:hypothetical protein
MGATYVVAGTVDKEVYDRLGREEELVVRLLAKNLLSGSDVASLRQRLTGGRSGENLHRDFLRPADVTVGLDAPALDPSPDVEAKILMRLLARRVVLKHGLDFKGKRVLLEPTRIRSVSGPRAELQAFLDGLDREFDAAQKKAAAAGAADPELAALEAGPVTVGGKSFESLAGAVEWANGEEIRLEATRSEELATDLSRTLGESLREAGGEFDLVVGDSGRRAVLREIRAETAAFRDDGAVDPATIAELRAKGADYLVRSTLRPLLKSYELRVLVHDMRSGKESSEVIRFGDEFKTDLDAVTTS